MSKNLTKREIVQKIYETHNFNHKDVTRIVQKTLDCIMVGLTNGKNIELRNFGVFELQVRKQRVGRNPNQPETDVVIDTKGQEVGFESNGNEQPKPEDEIQLDSPEDPGNEESQPTT